MDEQLKQRLVGGAVLVSLAVIFVPMLFDEHIHEETVLLDNRIPKKPASLLQEKPSILPEPIKPKERVVETIQQNEPEKAKQPITDKRYGKIDRPSPTAWVVQVASFSKQENAENLVQRLTSADLPAQQKTVNIDSKTHYRVQLLPQVNKKEAEQLAEKITKEFKLKVKVIRYPD